MVFHHIDTLCHERSGLPGKGAPGFEYYLEPGITSLEIPECTDKAWNIVVLPCHEVTSAEVDPLQLREPSCELLLYVCQCALKDITSTLAMAVYMEAVYVIGQSVGQSVG